MGDFDEGRSKVHRTYSRSPVTLPETDLAYLQIVLSPYGPHLLSSAFMASSRHATVMEFFPHGAFTREEESVARALGLKYIAWWEDRCVGSTFSCCEFGVTVLVSRY
jgi:hypothetical protein